MWALFIFRGSVKIANYLRQKTTTFWAAGYASIFARNRERGKAHCGDGLPAVSVLWAMRDVPHFAILIQRERRATLRAIDRAVCTQ
jgi:hypothetical protein